MSSNIIVAIRVRPLIQREKNEKLKEQWEVSENAIYPTDTITGKRNGDAYHFDHIFGNTCYNRDIYDTVVHPVVKQAINGFNGTVFAYGQTSSGKTYTMMGDTKEDGVISMAIQNIFLGIEQSVNRKFLLRVSYMEIYNEKIYDLLDVKNQVKVSENYSGSVVVNVREEVAVCPEKIYDIMRKGDKTRRIGETNMNEKSSRSHTIFRIIIESSDINDTGVVNVAHLNLVDLAGSERATFTKATGQRFKEGAHINKSLSTLSLVMKQLSDHQDFINFRDSKLTRILQSSLGGNALTAIICAITPAALEETHSTLAFASRAKTVKNKPLLNEVVTDEALINRNAQEISRLKRENKDLRGSNLQVEKKIAMLEKYILFSKNVNISNNGSGNKSRRKTWSAPQDVLPVIYETDVLRISEHLGSERTDSSLSNCPTSESQPLFSDDLVPSNTMTSTKENNTESDITDEKTKNENISGNSHTTEKSEDLVDWLIHSTDTPRSVLKERAEYYEREFKSLKELTAHENLLLTKEYCSEMENLKTELGHFKNELECEKKLRKEQENNFANEKELLKNNLDQMKNKYNELTEANRKLKKDNNAKNDCEFLVDMYKEKYKKREKELLDSLNEARELLKSKNSNSTDDEKKLKSSTDFPASLAINQFLDKLRNKLNTLKFEIETDHSITIIQNIFTELKMLKEEIPTDCTEEIHDILNVFQFIFDLAYLLLNDDNVILKLENEKLNLRNQVTFYQNKEKTYNLLVGKQDEEIKHLSENILQYMDELSFHKNELAKYKNLEKLETSIQTDLDSSCIADSKNVTDNINDSVFDRLSLTIESDQFIRTDNTLIAADRERIEFPSEVAKYIDQIKALQEELNKCKYSQQEQLAQIDILQNDVIEKSELLSSAEEKAKILEDEVNLKNKKTEELSLEIAECIDQLSLAQEKIKNQEDEINEKNNEINNITANVPECINNLAILNEIIQIHEKEIDLKSKTINNLSSEITYYKQNLSETMNCNVALCEKLDKFLLLMKNENQTLSVQFKNTKIDDFKEKLEIYDKEFSIIKKIMDDKNLEIGELSKKIDLYEAIITSKDDALVSAEEKAKILEDEVNLKNNKAEELSLKIAECMDQLSLAEKKIKNQEDEINEKNDKINNFPSRITECNNKIRLLEKNFRNLENGLILKSKTINNLLSKITNYDQKEKILEDEINLKNNKVEELSLKIAECIDQLSLQEKKIKNQEEEINEKDDKINNFTPRIKECLNGIKLLKERYRNLQNELDLKNNELDLKNKTINNLSSEITNNDQKLSETMNCNVALCEKLDKFLLLMKNENQTLRVQFKNTEINDFKEKLEIYDKEFSIIKKIMDDKYLEIGELSKRIDLYKAIITSKDDALVSAEVKAKILQDEVNLKNNKAEELSLKIAECINQLSMMAKKIKNLEDEINEKNNEINNITSNFPECINNLALLKEKIQIHQNELDSKSKTINNLSSEITNYDQKLSETMNCNVALCEKLDKFLLLMKNENQTLSVQFKNTKIDDFKEKLEIYDKEFSIIEKIMDDKNLEIGELSKKIDLYEAIITSKDDALVSAEEKAKILEDEVNLNNNKAEELSLKIAECIEQLSLAEKKIKNQEDEINEKNNEINNITSNVPEYINNLALLKEKIQIHKNELDLKSKTINNLSSEIKYYKQNLSETMDCNVALREKLDKFLLLTKNENQTPSVQFKNTEIDDFRVKLEIYDSGFSILEKIMDDKNVENVELSKKIDLFQAIITSKNEELKTQEQTLKKLNYQYPELKKIYKDKCEEATELFSKLNDYQEKSKEYERKIDSLEKHQSSMEKAHEEVLQKLREEIKENSQHTSNLRSQIFTEKEESEELISLRKKNEEYKKIVEKVSLKANNTIQYCNNTVQKHQQEIETLKLRLKNENEVKRSLQNQIIVLQQEFDNKNNFPVDDSLDLRKEILTLEEKNKTLNKILENHQELVHSKTEHNNKLRRNIESLKHSNSQLQSNYEILSKELSETKDLLKVGQSNLQLLEKEKENYCKNSRTLEETLEDVRFELHELKNKEKDRIKKLKRQSLHDSSRSLSSDEHLNIPDENSKSERRSRSPRQSDEFDNIASSRVALLEKQIDEYRQKLTTLQADYDKTCAKNIELIRLCKIRKQKIEDLKTKLPND